MRNTETTTAGSSSIEAQVSLIPPKEPERKGIADLFDVVVFSANEVRFVPKCELARSLLAMWQHGWSDAQATSTHRGDPTLNWRYGKTLDCLDVVFKSRPMLSSGDDPYFTGMVLKPEEVTAVRALVDRLRAAEGGKQRRERKARRRK